MGHSTKEDFMQLAKNRQQHYYECLPDWFVYEPGNLKYLKQSIGLAIFGLQVSNDDNRTSDGDDIVDNVIYTDEQKNLVNTLAEKICKYGKEHASDNVVWGIVYNIIYIYNKEHTTNSSKEQVSTISTEANDEQWADNAYPVPIFKIKTHMGGWYMDTRGRIYKSWEDYKQNNILPYSTMVLPKDGVYQADPSVKITETSSTVWLEIQDSATHSTKKKVIKYIDITSSAAGIGGLGIAAVSLFTPIGPITAFAGLAMSGTSGLWATGKCAQELVNRYTHKESLSDKNAVPAWFGLAGGALSIAASGGVIALTKSAIKGVAVGQVGRTVYNTVVIGDMVVNVIGIGWQGYNLYEQYQKADIKTIDVLQLTAHMLFFGCMVINCKFAGDIIRSSQGKVLQEFEANLRGKRLRNAYKRAKRLAAKNNSNEICKNAEIIRKIRKVYTTTEFSQPFTTLLGSQDSFLKIGEMRLINPIDFVDALISQGLSIYYNVNDSLCTSTDNDSNSVNNALLNYLEQLLEDLCSNFSQSIKEELFVSDFESFKNEVRYANDPADILIQVFFIALEVYNRDGSFKGFFKAAFAFVWAYFKEHLKQSGLSKSRRLDDPVASALLERAILMVFDQLDTIILPLIRAFTKYIKHFGQK